MSAEQHKKPRDVCLLSGGMDSAVTLAEARAAGFATHALTVMYGQRHASRPDLSEEDRQRLEQGLADAKENLQAVLDHFFGKHAVPDDGAEDAEKDAHGERAAEASSDGGG